MCLRQWTVTSLGDRSQDVSPRYPLVGNRLEDVRLRGTRAVRQGGVCGSVPERCTSSQAIEGMVESRDDGHDHATNAAPTPANVVVAIQLPPRLFDRLSEREDSPIIRREARARPRGIIRRQLLKRPSMHSNHAFSDTSPPTLARTAPRTANISHNHARCRYVRHSSSGNIHQ